MRLSKLSLTNFKSFKETQTIEFAPVTLLFGPNSVGKSTVLMALFYVQQILSKGQCNPQYIDALGKKYVGGFKNLVNGKDLSKSITIKIEYIQVDEIGSEYSAIRDFMNEDEVLNDKLRELGLDLYSATEDSEEVGIELEVSWSETNNDAYVSAYKVWLDNDLVMVTSCDAGMKQRQVTHINFLHHVFQGEENHKYVSFNGEIKLPEVGTDKYKEFTNSIYNISEKINVENFKLFLISESPLFKPIISDASNIDFSNESEFKNNINLIGYSGSSGALPFLNNTLRTTIIHDDEHVVILINELLSNALVSPLDNLLKLLNISLCIGPLRHIPDANYQVNPYPQQSDWYNGEACWDHVAKQDLLRDCKINHWLSDSDKLNIGYELVYKVCDAENRYVRPLDKVSEVEDALPLKDALGDFIEFSVSKKNSGESHNPSQTLLSNNFISELINKNKEDFNYVAYSRQKNTAMALWDKHNNIEVNASDIGVGVSQVLPLVVAAVTSKNGLIACEQPELHVHPRVQVAIGDLLTQVNDKAQFLIETHSEHLILRILRRIRESTDGELPAEFNRVTSSSISLVYLDSSDNGVVVKKIDVDEDGEFTSRWPQGFFSERAEELF